MLGIISAMAIAAGMSFGNVQDANQKMVDQMVYEVRKKAFNPYEKYGIYEDMEIVYRRGSDEVVLKAEDVVDWVRYWPDGHWDIDDAKMAEFMDGLQEKYNTLDGSKTFHTTMGEDVKITRGDYGWKLDRKQEIKELSQFLRSNGTTVHDLCFISRGSESEDPEKVYGDSYIEIDLSRQVLWMYQEGRLVLISNIVSGMMNTGRQTPSGAYYVKYKQSPAVLVGADYRTPVSYWMPFNGGIGLHDATWQPGFGGDACYYRGSHGCINLPLNIAGSIFEKIEKGYPVICYYSDPEDE